MDFVPICEYCGQVATTDQVFQSQEVANAWASCNCDCTGGKILRNRLKRAAEIHNAIDGLFDGDETVAPAQYIETLYKIGDAICDGYFSSVKIAIVGAGAVNISINSKGKIKVNRSVTVKNELEV